MKGRGFKLFALLAILTMAFGLTGAAFAAPADSPLRTDACPNGDGWTKIDSNDLSLYPVAGADDYCFKFGSENSQGCTGGTSDTWPPPVENYCGLSHWAYHMPEQQEPTNTPTPEDPTATPTPTDTPTEGPSPTPTVTNTPGGPTSTPPPPPREEPKTGPGDALPIVGITAFLGLLGIAGAGLRFATKHS